MKHNPYQVVKDFEQAIADYTGSKYAVAVSSCTEAIMLACAYHKVQEVTIPKHTYVGVPMAILNAGGRVNFSDEEWYGLYRLSPYNIWDSARWLTADMYKTIRNQSKGAFVCISLHWSKTLSVGWGGAILHDDKKADQILRKMRFDGRTEGVKPKDDTFDVRGYHCMMSPAQAAEALTRLSFLPRHNNPLPNDDYADLSKVKLFQR